MLWQALTDAIHERYPNLDLQLNPGTTVVEISAAESKLELTFPDSMRELLLEHDGQTQDNLLMSSGPPPIPPFLLGNGHRCTWGDFLPLSRIVDATLVNRSLAKHDAPLCDPSFSLVGPVRLHRNQIVISDPGSCDKIAIDLDPAEGGSVGQIIAINHDPRAVCLIAPNLAAFFDLLADGYRKGRFGFEEDDGFLEPIVYS